MSLCVYKKICVQCVCMYVDMYACMYVCVCVCVCLYARVCARMYVYVYACICSEGHLNLGGPLHQPPQKLQTANSPGRNPPGPKPNVNTLLGGSWD